MTIALYFVSKRFARTNRIYLLIQWVMLLAWTIVIPKPALVFSHVAYYPTQSLIIRIYCIVETFCNILQIIQGCVYRIDVVSTFAHYNIGLSRGNLYSTIKMNITSLPGYNNLFKVECEPFRI